jgi:acetylglutamate kinase
VATKAVLKLGGEVVADAQVLLPTLRDVASLVDAGARMLVCHGAGPQAGRLQEELGLSPIKVAGQRVTDDATLRVIKCVLGGEVNIDLVAAAASVGLRAVGLHGVSDAIVGALRRTAVRLPGAAEPGPDLGWVGVIERVRTDLLEHLWAGGFVPVLSPLGVDVVQPSDGPPQVYNINADSVAAAVAGALQADHLLLVTAVGGVRRDKHDPTTRIAALHASEARRAIEDGTIVDGMIPKVEEALEHLALGIGAVHILPPGAGIVREAVLSPGRHGTVLLAD